MKAKVYLDSSIIGYLTARPDSDVVIAGRQETTRHWWRERRTEYDLFVSRLVEDECGRGDPEMVRGRLNVLRGLGRLTADERAPALADALVAGGPLPEKASADALHIALCAVTGIDYLLTWNCRHMANAAMRRPIETICRRWNCEPPIICTPVELLGEAAADV